jgi:Na+/melibiose symporter-like transporter
MAQLLIIILIFTIPACIILSNKHRGAGYYILAVFFPVIGFIVALCLKKLPAEEQPQTQANDLDITNETRKK